MSRRSLSAEQIAELKARVPLPSLIGESVVLRRDTRNEYEAICPFHSEKTPSFRVYADHAHCFGCGWHGDALDFLREHERMSFPGAIRHLREWSGLVEPKAADDDDMATTPTETERGWLPITPVPDDAPPLIDHGIVHAFNPKRAETSWEWTRWRPALVHPYHTAAGELLGYVLRVEFWKDGKRKKFTPALTFCRHLDTGDRRWCVVTMPAPRPLYRLDELAARPSSTVLLVEGEKTADAAQRLLPLLVVSTWAGGAKAYHLTDFAPLRGRRVVAVPDADAEGAAAFDGRVKARGKRVAGILEILVGIGANARRVEPPVGLPDGWDLADALAEGWDTARTMAWIKANLARLADVA